MIPADTLIESNIGSVSVICCVAAFVAACNTHVEQARLSAEAQASDTQVTMEATPMIPALLAAVGSADVAQVRQLLESGLNPDDEMASRSPLVQAITSLGTGSHPALFCNVPMVRELLAHGADPNRADPEIHALPLQTAFDVGSIECVHMLVDAGSEIGLPESDGRTVLMAAVGAVARWGDTRLLDEALRLGADINERTKNGWTALHEAVRVNSVSVVNYLVDKGANVCARNDIGQTPSQMAINLDRDRQIIRALGRREGCQ
jgi:ankyrin repeat protein